MPRVPSEFVPQVPLQDGQMPAYQAPEVVPMRSFAGEQQAEMGTAMRNTGNVVWRIGQIIADEINEARVKESDVQLANAANTILRGEQGYFTHKGKAAEDQFGSAESALNEAANSILDGLDNDAQKAVFRQIAARNLNQWKGSMADYRNREVRDYNIGTSIARKDMYVDAAVQEIGVNGRTQQYEVDAQVAIRSTQEAMMLQGIPLGSPMMQEAEKKVWMSIASGSVRRMADSRMYQRALDYLEEEQRSGRLSEKDVGAMRSGLLERRRGQMAGELAYSIKNSGTFESESGTGNYRMPVDSGDVQVTTDENKRMKYSVLADTPIHAPTDAVVEDVGEDGVTLRASDGTIMHFNGVGRPMVTQGQKVNQRAVIGIPRQSEDGRAEFTYTMTRNGVVLSPTNPNTLPIGLGKQEFKPPTSLSEALSLANQIPDQDLRKDTLAELRNLYAQDAERYQAERIDAIVGVKSQIAQQMEAEKDLPMEQRRIVTRTQVIEALGDKRLFLTDKDIQDIVDMTPTPQYVDLMFQAGRLTPEQLKNYADVVSPADYARMQAALTNPQYQEYRITQEELDEIFTEVGMSDYVNPKKGSRFETESINVRRNVNDLIRNIQVEKGRKLTREEREGAIKDALGVHVWKKGAMFWAPERAMVSASTEADKRPVRGKKADGSDEDYATYKARLDEWRSRSGAVARFGETEERIPVAQVRSAMTELAIIGQPVTYEYAVPTARAMEMMADARIPGDQIRRVLRDTANMDPNARALAVEYLMLQNRAVTTQSVIAADNELKAGAGKGKRR